MCRSIEQTAFYSASIHPAWRTCIFLVQVQLRTEVHALLTPSSTQPIFELMTSRSWQYISCHWTPGLTIWPSVTFLVMDVWTPNRYLYCYLLQCALFRGYTPVCTICMQYYAWFYKSPDGISGFMCQGELTEREREQMVVVMLKTHGGIIATHRQAATVTEGNGFYETLCGQTRWL